MEVDTRRERLLKYCKGCGVDLGFGGTAISRSAIAVDREEHDPSRARNPDAMPTHLVGDVRNLYWFRDGVLDYVFSSHCLEDFVDVEAVLKEWLRVIKPGGYLVLFLPDEVVYRSITPDEIRNQAHKHPDFSLQFVKNCLHNLGYGEETVAHEMWPVPNNLYSFDLDQIRNQAHKHPDFSLQFVKNCLHNLGYGEETVAHEMWPVPNNLYSFD